MKNILSLITCSAVLVTSLGCTGLASVARQLKDDKAFVTVEVKTLYGSGIMVRDGRVNSSTTVSDSGAVASAPGTNSNITPPVAPRSVGITPEQFQAMVNAKAAELAKANAPAVSTNSGRARAERRRSAGTNSVTNVSTNAPAK